MMRRFLLPVGLDQEGRRQAVRELALKHARRNLVTTGYVHDVYPDERGWIDQPGNSDTRRRVYYAHIHTKRK